jgi:hypothetical protein
MPGRVLQVSEEAGVCREAGKGGKLWLLGLYIVSCPWTSEQAQGSAAAGRPGGLLCSAFEKGSGRGGGGVCN